MKKLKIIITCLSALITLAFLAVAIQRLRWDYTETGNHFDEPTATNYTENGIVFYTITTILFALMTLMLVVNVMKSRPRK